MATSLPTVMPTPVNPTDPPDLLSTTSPAVLHTDQHAFANDSIVALATMIGLGSTGPVANSVFAGTSTTQSGFTDSPTVQNITVLGSQIVGGDFGVTGVLSVTGATHLTGLASLIGGLAVTGGNIAVKAGPVAYLGVAVSGQYNAVPAITGNIASAFGTGPLLYLQAQQANDVLANYYVNPNVTYDANGKAGSIGAGIYVGTVSGATSANYGGYFDAPGGGTINASIRAVGLVMLDSNLQFTAASAKVIPGATSLLFQNSGNTLTNMSITDAGVVTFRAAVGGITTLTATTLAGTLSTAAQTAITSVGTLTSLTMGGTLTVGANTLALAGATVSGTPTWSSTQAMNISGSSASTSGSAATLSPGRNINGTAFNGSADITVTAAAGTLTGATLNSTVTASSLTSVGVLTALALTGTIGLSGATRSIWTTDANILQLGAAGVAILKLTNSGGAQVGAPTGADKGVGTLNATGLYVNGTAVGVASNLTKELGSAVATSSQTVTSTATPGTDLTSLTVTATPDGTHPAYVDLFMPQMELSSTARADLCIQKDGSVVTLCCTIDNAGGVFDKPVSLRYRDAAPTNASHTWKASAYSSSAQNIVFTMAAAKIALITVVQVAT